MTSKALRRSISVSALGQQPLQLDRADLGAVLLLLAAALRLLVAVELALDPVGGAVEQVDGGPEQVLEIGLEARVGEGGDQGVEDVGERGADWCVPRAAAADRVRPGRGGGRRAGVR